MLRLFAFLCLCIAPIASFAFEISSLATCSAVAVKKMAVTDAIYKSENSRNNQFYGNKQFVSLLGKQTQVFDTNYVYLGPDKKEQQGISKWYYYSKTSSGRRGTSKLNYEKNDVMRAARAGDIAVICKRERDLVLVVVQQDSSHVQELYSVLGTAPMPTAEKTSWWRRLWATSEKHTADYEIDTAALPMPTIPEKSWVRIYFTPGPKCEDNIVASINAATRAIDVAVYSITNDRIVDSLLAAHRRGVRVRVISDHLQASGRASQIGRIRDGGIPVVLNKKHKIMHNKFAIFDRRDIETGSYNWTSSATQSNAENCMFFPEQNKEFTSQFKYLWDFYQG